MALRAITSPNFPPVAGAGDGPHAGPDKVTILLHGYGSNEHDLAGLAPHLPGSLPWASLRAPLDMGYGGAAWFPLDGDWLRPEPIEEATRLVWECIDAHVPATTAISALGFSQGGLMVTQLLRTRPERVAHAVVLSGFVLTTPQPGDAVLAQAQPPVFWGRGTADPVIPPALVSAASAWFADHVMLTEKIYPGMGHSVNDAELADVARYLQRD